MVEGEEVMEGVMGDGEGMMVEVMMEEVMGGGDDGGVMGDGEGEWVER